MFGIFEELDGMGSASLESLTRRAWLLCSASLKVLTGRGSGLSEPVLVLIFGIFEKLCGAGLRPPAVCRRVEGEREGVGCGHPLALSALS